jgi:hypothetical protein
MMVVTTPALAESVEELMMDVEVASPLIVEVSVFTADERSFELRKDAVVVAVLPLTIEVRVKELVLVDTVRVLEVEDATRLVRSVVVATPLMVVVRVAPEVERELLVMTDVVAVRPLIVVVRILPAVDCVKELMMEAIEEEIPLTIVWKKLADEEATFEVMMVEVPTEPPMLEVRVLPDEERELVTDKLLAVRLLAVSWDAEVVASVEVPNATRLVVVALVVVKLVNTEVTAFKRVEKKLVEVAEVVVSSLAVSEDAVVVASVEVPVMVSVVPVAEVKRRLVKEESADTTREAIVVVPVNVLSPANV